MDERYVNEMASRLGLALDPARRRGVLGNLQRIEQLARPVLEVELGPEDELGPEWKP